MYVTVQDSMRTLRVLYTSNFPISLSGSRVVELFVMDFGWMFVDFQKLSVKIWEKQKVHLIFKTELTTTSVVHIFFNFGIARPKTLGTSGKIRKILQKKKKKTD